MSGEALTIGEVIGRLAADFPDLTVSKIRYLESGGLISPGRTPAGYRRFTEDDVEKLRWVLAAQRDQYLPLKVIRQHLAADGPRVTAGDADAIVAALTSGADPAPGTDPDLDRAARWSEPAASRAALGAGSGSGSSSGPASGSGAAALTPPLPPLPQPRARAATVADAEFYLAGRSDVGELYLSREALARTAGVSESFVDGLIAYGLLPNTEEYGGDSMFVVRAASALSEYGLEPRHLRPLLTGARNTAGLLGTLLPTRRHDGVTGSGRQAAASRAATRTAEASAAAVKLYAALLRAELGAGAAPAGQGTPAAHAPTTAAPTASITAAPQAVAAPDGVPSTGPSIGPSTSPSTAPDPAPAPPAPASGASSRNPGMPGGPAAR